MIPLSLTTQNIMVLVSKKEKGVVSRLKKSAPIPTPALPTRPPQISEKGTFALSLAW